MEAKSADSRPCNFIATVGVIITFTLAWNVFLHWMFMTWNLFNVFEFYVLEESFGQLYYLLSFVKIWKSDPIESTIDAFSKFDVRFIIFLFFLLNLHCERLIH